MDFDGNLDIKAREIEDLKKTPEELTRQAAMRWADGQIDPLLPQAPFFLHIVGGIGKGKTTIILNMLREYQKYNTFCRVIYLSPSGKNDAKLRMFLTADNPNFEYTAENLTKLMEEIERENAELKNGDNSPTSGPTPAAGSQDLSPQEVKRRISRKVPTQFGSGTSAALSGLAAPKSAPKTKEDLAKDARKKVSCRTLIIADDATGSILTARNSPFTKFLVSIRHQDTSIILCTHSDTSLSAQLRNIVTGQILFEPGSGRELKTIVDDVGGVSQETLLNILGHVQRVPHGFVFIDKKRPFRDRFILNFKNVMDPDSFRQGATGGLEGKTLELFRSGGFLPTPAQATSAEAPFAEKAYQLQQEAILLNRGLTPAEKILQEQNASAKRKRQVESSAKTSTAKRAQVAGIARAAKRQRASDAVVVNSAIRQQAFRTNAAARLTQTSQRGGVLDAKFNRGVSRNVAIATGGRRGIGGRGRRSAAALGPLAQQLEENIRLQADLKAQRDQLSKDEEARKAEAEKEAAIPAPPPLPAQNAFELAVKDRALAFSQARSRREQEQAAAANEAIQDQAIAQARANVIASIKATGPVEQQMRDADATQIVENQPITQAEAARQAINVVDTELKDAPGALEGPVKEADELPPPTQDAEFEDVSLPDQDVDFAEAPPLQPVSYDPPATNLAPVNTDSSSGPAFAGFTPGEDVPLNFSGAGSGPTEFVSSAPTEFVPARNRNPEERQPLTAPTSLKELAAQRAERDEARKKKAAQQRAQNIAAARATPQVADPVPMTTNTQVDVDQVVAPSQVNATGGTAQDLSGVSTGKVSKGQKKKKKSRKTRTAERAREELEQGLIG
jgi:hypothetical protein